MNLSITDLTFSPETIAFFYIIFWLIIAWTAVWKGIALWKSARRNNKTWFIILLVVNTFGILEILYIFIFSKKEKVVEHKQITKTKEEILNEVTRN